MIRIPHRTLFALVLTPLALVLACSETNNTTVAAPVAPSAAVDISTASADVLEQINVISTVDGVTIASPPVVRFTLASDRGEALVGLTRLWEQDRRFVRFTLSKLVAGQNGDPDSWVAYVRDNGEPDYDTGASLVDHGDGSYSFTFNTDVNNVPGIPYEPMLTHRIAGQIGSRSVPLEAQNLWMDFVPNGGMVTHTRNIATMDSCNECHQNLVFHGRRFAVEYCVACHNPDLSQGEGDFAFMIHRIHAGGDFNVLEGGISYAEVTYPQEVTNCRKCHDGDDARTADADNWRTVPHMAACAGCHDNFGPFATQPHSSPIPQPDNQACALCHNPDSITMAHAEPNASPNNPELLAGQRFITYELVDATLDAGTNAVTIQFRILSDGTPLDVTNLPADLKDGSGAAFRYPVLLLAYATPQAGMPEPADWDNLGRADAQPIGLSLGDFTPNTSSSPVGTLGYDSATGIITALVTDPASQFPVGTTMRTVGLQGYLQQDLDGDGSNDVSLHAVSAVATVAGDEARRAIVDTAKCAACHEWFDGHGGNRVFAASSQDFVCTMCHVPNLSSSGRELDLTNPEDAQNMKDMIHGIHASEFRTRAYTHVRNFRGGRSYDWSEVTFPRGADVADCTLCHVDGTYGLPLPDGVQGTTVRTTSVFDGMDPTTQAVVDARDGTALPNATDWVNSPTASACFYCHTSNAAWAHMTLNGGQLSIPDSGPWVNRGNLVPLAEACAVCHGPGRTADLEVAHRDR